MIGIVERGKEIEIGFIIHLLVLHNHLDQVGLLHQLHHQLLGILVLVRYQVIVNINLFLIIITLYIMLILLLRMVYTLIILIPYILYLLDLEDLEVELKVETGIEIGKGR